MRRLRLNSDPRARHLLIGLPVLTIVVLGLADWTIAAERRARIEAAARAATDLVRAGALDEAAIAASVQAAAANLPDITVAPPSTWCECAAVPIDCSAMCAGGLWRYVRIGASIPHSRISPVGPTTVSAHITLRLP